MLKTDTLEEDLMQFSGTENYHKHFLGLLMTDGVKYMADNGGEFGAYWLIDAIGSYQKSLKKCEFQLWELVVN